jgi:hypothetical protein
MNTAAPSCDHPIEKAQPGARVLGWEAISGWFSSWAVSYITASIGWVEQNFRAVSAE